VGNKARASRDYPTIGHEHTRGPARRSRARRTSAAPARVPDADGTAEVNTIGPNR